MLCFVYNVLHHKNGILRTKIDKKITIHSYLNAIHAILMNYLQKLFKIYIKYYRGDKYDILFKESLRYD